MLTGQAKTDYMRAYMRKRRAKAKGEAVTVGSAFDNAPDDRETRALRMTASIRASLLGRIADCFAVQDAHTLQGNKLYETYDDAGNCDQDAADAEWGYARDAEAAAIDLVVRLIKAGHESPFDNGATHDRLTDLIAKAEEALAEMDRRAIEEAGLGDLAAVSTEPGV